MTLTLRVLQTPKGVASLAPRRIGAAACPFTIGRGSDNDWVLEDPDRHISKHHCCIEADGDGFYLVDLSSNGVFFASESRPLGRDRRRPLDVGDSFRIGDYRIALGREAGAGLPAIADGPVLAGPTAATGTGTAGPDIAAILAGTTQSSERRVAQTVTGTASEWLAAMPGGTVDERVVQPMRWQAPPATALTEPPEDMTQPLSALADRNEHVPAMNGALQVGAAGTLLPLDWHLGEDTVVAAKLGARAGADAPDWSQAQAAVMEGAALMRLLPDAAADAATADEGREALVRTGRILRRLLDALAAIEAVQRTSEQELGLSEGAASTEDLPGLLAAAVWTAEAAATDRLIQRVAGLARHARAFAVAVAGSAGEIGAQIQPAAIEDDAREAARLAVGPLLKAASWERYCAVHANLAGLSEAPPADAILAPLRRSFAQRA